MQITVTVPDELAAEAEARGLSAEAYGQELLIRAAVMELRMTEEPEIRRRNIDSMRRFAKEHNLTLGEGLSIKDLINEGRKH
jgi:hypothetical protein